MPSAYGTITEANAYFATKLHTSIWDNSNNIDRQKALYQATRIIDRLNFRGNKTTVYDILLADEDAEDVDIRDAELSQELEFPRDGDTVIPLDIQIACFEIAFNLLDGVDPDIELENLGIESVSYAGVKTGYYRNQEAVEHLTNGIPSATAWRYLLPFLRDSRSVKLTKI